MKTKFSLFFTSIVLGCSLASSSVAYAQNTETMAQARFHEGLAFLKAGQYDSARLAFSQALALRRDSDTLWNLAIAEKASHHEVEASRHIREYLRRPDHQVSDEANAKKLLEEMAPSIGHLRITAPAGAAVIVDGETLEQAAPLSEVCDVAVGKHVVRAMEGTHADEKKVEASAGGEVTVTLTFESASSSGGSHVVEPPRTEERTKMFPPPTGAIILGGVGVVGLGLGIGFGLASASSRSDLDARSCTTVRDPSCSDSKSTGERDATISWISYVAGGVLVAGGVVWWIAAPRKETVSVGFVPSLGPGQTGAMLRGTF